MLVKIIIPCIIAIILLQGCSNQSKEVQNIKQTNKINTETATITPAPNPVNSVAPLTKSTNKPNGSSISDQITDSPKLYFPKEKVTLRYSGGFENGGFTKDFKIFTGDRVQVVETSTGAAVVSIYIENDEEIRHIFSKEGYSEDKDYINAQPNINNILLKAPVKLGTTWKGDDGELFTITGTNVIIKTPAGNFSCVEVESRKEDSESKRYYAKNIGLVKDIFKYKGFEMISEILEIKK